MHAAATSGRAGSASGTRSTCRRARASGASSGARRRRLRPLRGVAAALLIFGSLPLLSGCSPPPRPNVVLISLDTVRADRMSLYGAPRTTSPRIDALAAAGLTFDDATSPSPWTLPAHAAMLSGRYPGGLSVTGDGPLFSFATLLPERLGALGYRTAAFTGGGFLSQEFGAANGFDSFAVGGAAEAASWIDQVDREPFFLFFHTYRPHVPYRDRRFAKGLDAGRLAGLYKGPRAKWRELHLALTCGELELTAAEKEYLLALYDGGIAAADEEVGQLLDALARRELMPRTVVVVTSDHGEEFWDHSARSAYHGHTLYRELLRVPLVWSDPQLREGRRSAVPVNLVDLVPTILARVGGQLPRELDGFDLGALLRGADALPERAIYGEAVRNGPERFSVRRRGAKFILTPRPEEQRFEGERCAVPVRAIEELFLAADRRSS
ncbi:MAG: sulfatase [Thermoanaerobaculia bacterium]